jgi:hypothetical protein
MFVAILIVVAVVSIGRRMPQSVPILALVALVTWFGSVCKESKAISREQAPDYITAHYAHLRQSVP